MAEDTRTSHRIGELLTTRRHTADFTASRCTYLSARLRPLALVLGLLLPLWIPVDYLLLPAASFIPMAVLRIAAGAFALALYFLAPHQGRRLSTLCRLGMLLLIPVALYTGARLMLGVSGDNLLYGYGFFPVLVAAMLAVFPLTLLEGLAFGLPLLLGYAALEFFLGAAPEAIWLGMLWQLGLVMLIALWAQLSQLRMLLDLYHRATRDALTGVLTRSSLAERLAAEHSRWARYGRPMSVMLVELAGLKRVGSEHGHAVSNRLLNQLAKVVSGALRPTDLVGRWDTDTLLVVLPETAADEAGYVAARVREVAELASVTAPGGAKVHGEPRVAVGAPQAHESVDALLERIDRTLLARRPSALAS